MRLQHVEKTLLCILTLCFLAKCPWVLSCFFRIGSVKAMIHHNRILVHLCCAFALYRRRFKRSLWPFSCASWRYGSGYVIPPLNWNEVTL